MQNLAVAFTWEPQELHIGPVEDPFGRRDGSGGGRTPGVEKAAAAETIDGG